MRTILILTVVIFAAAAVSIPKAMRCPEIADAHVSTGWSEYRAGRMGNAQRAFAAALERCPGHPDSQVGLGFVALRNLSFDSAASHFRQVLAGQPAHVDALVGMGLVHWRTLAYDSARATFHRALRIDPSRQDIVGHIASLPAPVGPPPVRAPLVLPDSLAYPARVSGEHFEIRTRNGWERFYINGVNLGAALPGKFPSEFPGIDTYRDWVRQIAAMGANTIRVYTLHPPAFYEALAEHNAAHPERTLWLLHGVWAELPPGDDYYDAGWQGEFFANMETIVDVLHGRADVPHRPGSASGYYTADVSRWTLGFILGREWEPFSVAEFNARNPGRDAWQGRYLGVGPSTPMDAWLAQALEHVVAYETETYRAQRPVAYTNWPTLDPMRHPTELDSRTELEIRGMPFDRSRVVHNEDEVSIGAPVEPTAAFPAGYFAAYHVYPYYPDFFLHDPEYGAAESPWGASSFYGYLADLKAHVPGVPLLIAEYGIPTSWGISHFNPQGWHHGGHGEAEQAEVVVRLTREIAAAGMAGGVVFSFIDEWFKHNWLLEPFEQPNERSRLWWNRMNPEQHYGVLAVEPVRRLGETLAERRVAWDTLPTLYATDDGVRLRAHADEAYLWLQVQGPAVRAERLVVGLDIIDPDAGGMRLPGAGAPDSPVGLELVLVVDSGQARLRATPRAQQYRLEAMPKGATKADRRVNIKGWAPDMFMGSWAQYLNEPFLQEPARDGRFDPLLVAVNRARVAADSTNWFGYGYDRGVLRPGALPDGAWERAGDVLEVRLPWNLLNVTDPSSRQVVAADARVDERVAIRQVDAVRLTLATRDAAGAWQVWPQTGRREDVARFTWPTWDEPRYRVRRRPVFDALRTVYRELSTTDSRRASLP